MMRAIKLSKITLRRIKPVFILLMLGSALFLNIGYAAQIQVSADRNPASIDESFQIIFTAKETPDDDPDFSPLEQDFDIISQSNSSSSSWINGKSSKSIQWTLTVMAKQVGSLVIPPVRFGNDISGTATVLVTQDAAKSTANSGEDLFLEVEATPENPYVQSQIIYTMRFYTRVEIARASMNEPELADAVIEKLTEDANYTTRINGVDYSVTERKYAIFPQKSGIMTIKPLLLTAEVLTANRQGFNGWFGSQLTKTRRVASKAITMEVKPAPAAFTGQHWLSAEQLVLKEEWSGDIQQMKVGEPLTRTLTLEANGATVGQLPELNAAKTDDRIKTYPDQPILREQKQPEGLIAFRQEKIALIPSAAGSYALPAIDVPWFNTKTQTMEIARIPEAAITAVAAAEAGNLNPVTTATAPQPLEAAGIVRTATASIWLWLSIFLAAGWLATVVYFMKRRSGGQPVTGARDDVIAVPDSVKNLKKACNDNNATAAKNALIDWGRQNFNVASLGAISDCCDARLRDEILYLNRILYGKERESWQGKKLYQAFIENKARTKIAADVDHALEPLYRL